ncbi:hypothetical protein AVEN_144416-1, partial [Araneus ventricosus]
AVVETVVKASEYADLVIDEGNPINADMVFDKAKNHLYVMTEKRPEHFSFLLVPLFGDATCVSEKRVIRQTTLLSSSQPNLFERGRMQETGKPLPPLSLLFSFGVLCPFRLMKCFSGGEEVTEEPPPLPSPRQSRTCQVNWDESVFQLPCFP